MTEAEAQQFVKDHSHLTVREYLDLLRQIAKEVKQMHLNIFDAVYCPRHDVILSLAVCKKGLTNEGCSCYEKETVRNDGVRELICSYGEVKNCPECEGRGIDGEFGPRCPICNGTGKVTKDAKG